MKMKKLIMLVALLVAGTAQADSLNWGGGANAGGTTAWTNSLSWWSQAATAWGAVPTSNDIVYIETPVLGSRPSMLQAGRPMLRSRPIIRPMCKTRGWTWSMEPLWKPGIWCWVLPGLTPPIR